MDSNQEPFWRLDRIRGGIADGDVGDGYFAILDSEGLPVAMIEPAWALDANGEAVDTHYEVAGNELVQIVNHGDGDAYPIVADPAVKCNPS